MNVLTATAASFGSAVSLRAQQVDVLNSGLFAVVRLGKMKPVFLELIGIVLIPALFILALLLGR